MSINTDGPNEDPAYRIGRGIMIGYKMAGGALTFPLTVWKRNTRKGESLTRKLFFSLMAIPVGAQHAYNKEVHPIPKPAQGSPPGAVNP